MSTASADWVDFGGVAIGTDLAGNTNIVDHITHLCCSCDRKGFLIYQGRRLARAVLRSGQWAPRARDTSD